VVAQENQRGRLGTFRHAARHRAIAFLLPLGFRTPILPILLRRYGAIGGQRLLSCDQQQRDERT
jgi:hypothetical protein